MPTKYRKAAPKKRRERETQTDENQPKQRDHKGVPQLAAKIANVSIWMAYKVLYGQAQSKKVEAAIEEARRQLGVAA